MVALKCNIYLPPYIFHLCLLGVLCLIRACTLFVNSRSNISASRHVLFFLQTSYKCCWCSILSLKMHINFLHFGHIHLFFPHFLCIFLHFSPINKNKHIKRYLCYYYFFHFGYLENFRYWKFVF